jgi:hypothetical protein
VNQQKTAQAYYQKHCICPDCGCPSEEMSQTTMGVIFGMNGETEDDNFCECKCGWKGRVWELVENPITNQERTVK